jgi:DNA-binding YbaB/EbfC family protein
MQQLMSQMMSAMATKNELDAAEVTGTAGGGMVTATVTGAGTLTGLVIDPQAVDPEDTETLADLVVAAVRAASAEAQQAQADTMGPLAGGLPGLPGLGM